MNKSKRRIVALSTAFAMAFVMVASLVLGFTSEATEPIDSVTFTFTPPAAGTTYSSKAACQTAMQGCVTVSSVPAGAYVSNGSVVLCKSNGSDLDSWDVTLQPNTDYYARFELRHSTYEFNPSNTQWNHPGTEVENIEYVGYNVPHASKDVIITIKFQVTGTATTLTKASVNVTAPAIDSTMTIGTTQPNITVPDNANYTIGEMRYMTKDEVDALINAKVMAGGSSTSTKVKEDDVYYAQIILKPKAGYAFDINATTYRPNFEPTVEGNATYYGAGYSSGNSVQFFVKVTVPKASAPVEPAQPSDTPAATQDTATATTTTTTAAAAATPTTETATAPAKTAPKTGDSMPIVAITFVIVGASAIGVVVYRRRRS